VDKLYLIIIILGILAGVVGLEYYNQIPNDYYPTFSSNVYPSNMINATQGSSCQVNLTLTSLNTKTTVPIQNLDLTVYNSTIDYKTFIGTDDNSRYSLLQERYFTYSFSPNELTLQSHMSNSTILTINIAKDAPSGQYTFNITLGPVTVHLGLYRYYTETVLLGIVVSSR